MMFFIFSIFTTLSIIGIIYIVFYFFDKRFEKIEAEPEVELKETDDLENS